jgi:hypothetical protein
MINRRLDYKVEIDWRSIKHISPKIDDKNITLEVKTTTKPLPRVMVITNVSDPILFAFCVYSWNSVLYPPELLNWVIIDSKNMLTKESLGNSADDTRIRVVKTKWRNLNDAVDAIMEMSWVPTNTPVDSSIVELPIERPIYYTLMDCGDVWFPDNLGLKFRSLEEGYDCVIPNTLAYYSPLAGTSLSYKYFLKFPRSGLYWKKRWWKSKSSKHIVGVPYLANSVTIGSPAIDAMCQPASVRFFDNFPTDVKVMIRKIIQVLNSQRDADSDSDGNTDDLDV